MTQLSTQPLDNMNQPLDPDEVPIPAQQFVSDEDDIWEDIPENGTSSEEQADVRSTKFKSRVDAFASPSIRRRKPHYIAPSNRRGSVAPVMPKRRPPPRRQIPTEDIMDNAVQGALFTGRYLLDVLKTAINLMRKPLGIMTFVLLLSICMGYIAHYLQKALTPFCFLPFVNRSAMCAVLVPQTKIDPWEQLIQVQTKTFDQLLDESAGGSSLSLEVKKAEMATADLVTLVRHSDLRTRDILASSLKEFVEDARKTGRGLQKMSAKVAGAVDNILAVNTYALRTIEDANAKKPSIFNSLIPWSKNSKEVVANTFADAMGVLSANLGRLILEAEANLGNLNALEEQLSTLDDMVAREGITTKKARDELLSELWSILGGNRKELKNFDSHFVLLKQLGMFRKKALIHVTAALETLRAMSDDMEDLRERAATPELVGPSIPMEVHIQSIQNGIERLRDGRTKARMIEADAVRRVLETGPGDKD
ncbi:hypothetical protein AX15_004139 [Amanita polypyramis BW_CC]|nr:hypothetical protein AX15_004139 [Amanita polypyramis BW_CC]